MAKEYIEREGLIDYLRNIPPEGYERSILGKITLNEIEKFPAADVAPIIHAQWVWKEVYGEPGLVLMCSNCEETEGARENHIYCHNCGAHMNGGNKNE